MFSIIMDAWILIPMINQERKVVDSSKRKKYIYDFHRLPWERHKQTRISRNKNKDEIVC